MLRFQLLVLYEKTQGKEDGVTTFIGIGGITREHI